MAINPERQRVLDYLAQFGLDGKVISRDSISEDGFQIRGYTTRHPWPKGFNFHWLESLIVVADRADFRRQGIRLKKDVVE